MQIFNVNDRVVVPAWVEGYGEDKTGTIITISKMDSITFYEVMYDTVNSIGNKYISVFENQIIKL